MDINGKKPAAGAFAPGALILTLAVEGDPNNICHRTVYGTVDGLVRYRLELTTMAQPAVAAFLRGVANEFAAKEGSIVAPVT